MLGGVGRRGFGGIRRCGRGRAWGPRDGISAPVSRELSFSAPLTRKDAGWGGTCRRNLTRLAGPWLPAPAAVCHLSHWRVVFCYRSPSRPRHRAWGFQGARPNIRWSKPKCLLYLSVSPRESEGPSTSDTPLLRYPSTPTVFRELSRRLWQTLAAAPHEPCPLFLFHRTSSHGSALRMTAAFPCLVCRSVWPRGCVLADGKARDLRGLLPSHGVRE